MIINKSIKIKVNPNSREYYRSIGYECNNYDIIEVKTVDISPGSNLLIGIKCDNCLKEINIRYNKYYLSTKSLSDFYYCKECNHIKAKKTKLEKYGDENYQNIEKRKKTNLERYGNENYTNKEAAIKTMINRYGVDNASKSKEIKQKRTNTYLKKYGVSNPFESEEIKMKIKETNLEKYGTEYYLLSNDCKNKYNTFCEKLGVYHYSESNEFKDKFKNTCIKRWGHMTNLLNNEIRDKAKETNIIKYGFDHAMKNKDISLISSKSLILNRNKYFYDLGYEYIDYDFDNKIYKLKKISCGHIFSINYDLFRSRVKYKNNSCLECYPKEKLCSIKEHELFNWLISLKLNAIQNNRTILDGKELDIYLPDFNLAIEFNGLYYHSDKFKHKEYHLEKTQLCYDKGIELIHIWEDDWVYKTDIIKSIILNKIGKLENRIWARKCTIKEITTSEAKLFLEKNHIQGYTTSSIRLGLFHNNKLVSVMTFGNRRINSKNNYELIRFSNLLNTSVLGSASRLFNYFLKNLIGNIERIVSYSDISIFNGNVYKKLGFKKDGKTSINYYWTDLNRKYHRFNFNKKKLVKMGYDSSLTEEQIMKNIGYYKIYSCGQIRWVY